MATWSWAGKKSTRFNSDPGEKGGSFNVPMISKWNQIVSSAKTIQGFIDIEYYDELTGKTVKEWGDLTLSGNFDSSKASGSPKDYAGSFDYIRLKTGNGNLVQIHKSENRQEKENPKDISIQKSNLVPTKKTENKPLQHVNISDLLALHKKG